MAEQGRLDQLSSVTSLLEPFHPAGKLSHGCCPVFDSSVAATPATIERQRMPGGACLSNRLVSRTGLSLEPACLSNRLVSRTGLSLEPACLSNRLVSRTGLSLEP